MPKTIYFAGKVRAQNDYRRKLLGSDHCMSFYGKEYFVGEQSLLYGGPLAIGCDHGCFHAGDSRHGCGYEGNTCTGFEWRSSINPSDTPVNGFLPKEVIVNRCLHHIRRCDAVHAYIDSFDCFGTLTELGYAAAMDKPIYLVFSEKVHVEDSEGWECHDLVDASGCGETHPKDELWFIKKMPNVIAWCVGYETTIHNDLLCKSFKSVKIDDNRLRNQLNTLWEGQE